MQFRFKDKERPRAYTSSLSGILHVSYASFIVLKVSKRDDKIYVCEILINISFILY